MTFLQPSAILTAAFLLILSSASLIEASKSNDSIDCPAAGKKPSSKLICYYGKSTNVADFSCKCSHVVIPAEGSDAQSIDGIRERLKGVKILITVREFNQALVDLLKSSKVDGIEVDLKKLDSKSDIDDFISTIRSKLGSNLHIAVSVPAKAETLAKYYDFKSLSKSADLFVLQTAFLGASHNVTFHPSRLSGLWDMQNTDSVVDLVSGLGAPLSKLVIASPVQAFKFTLQSEKHTAPGSPALEVQSITRDELCKFMGNGANWTLERDQDQAGPYIFSKDQWIAFEDTTSIDIKAKYSRVRGLAGLALKDLSQDGGLECDSATILDAAFNGLSHQSRAPRGAVLHSLEREILATSTPARPLDKIQVSPYRISRVIDVEGNVHVIRQDTRTEFECARQGYFVHPRSCNRFYRCVKFDQLSDEFSVFEFDCPAGLAFDNRVEVCVWPGSLPHSSACTGSSEIAPVPKQRFVCPEHEGYFADPENCRWFFACLDHGKSPMSAYEFRCPFGLVFDESRLLCEWPWLVPRCGNGYAAGSEVVYGGSAGGTAISLDQYDGLGVLGVTALGGLQGPIEQTVSKVYSNVGTASGLGGTGVESAQILDGKAQATYISPGGLLNSNNGYVGLSDYDARGSTVQSSAIGAQTLDGKAQTAYISSEGLLNNNNGYVGLSDYDARGSTVQAAAIGAQILDGKAQTAYISSGGLLNNNNGYVGLNDYEARGSSVQASATGVNGLYATGAVPVATSVSSATRSDGIGILQGAGVPHRASIVGSSGYAAGYLQQGTVPNSANVVDLGGYVADGSSGVLQSAGSTGRVLQGNYGYASGQYQGLSAKTLQSLQNAGLLKSGTLVNQQGYAQYYDGVSGSGSVGNLYYAANAGGYQGGAKSQQSFTQYHGGVSSTSGLDSGAGLYQNNLAVAVNSGLGYNANQLGSTAELGLDTRQQGQIEGGNLHLVGASGNVASSNAQLVNSLEYNNLGGTNAVQYQVNTGGTNYASGTAGGINILGGGYSAVGVLKSGGVQVSSNGESSTSISHVTPSPISVTTVSSIPAVTSVPLPSIDTVSAFQSLNGGVVANVPELQLRVQQPLQNNVYYQSGLGVANLTSYVNHVSSVPATVSRGYQYPRPTVAFVEEPSVRTIAQPVVVSTTATPIVLQPQVKVQSVISGGGSTFGGYVYTKPAIKFEETPVKFGGSFSYQQVDTAHRSGGYAYPKPAVAFEEVPLRAATKIALPVQPVVVSTTAAPIVIQPEVRVQQPTVSVQGYDYPKPAVRFEETSKPVTANGGSFSFQRIDTVHKSQGYAYPKPAVAFEEVPQNNVVATATIQPVISVHQTTQQGYSYPRPNVRFEERPQQVQGVVTSYNTPSSTVSPLVVQNVVQQPASFSFSSQPKATVSYQQVPSAVPTYVQQPAVVAQPVRFSVKPGASSYTYQNVLKQAVRHEGYSYPRPTVAFEETPASVTRLDVVQKPTVVENYSYLPPSRPVEVQAQQPTPVQVSYSYTAPSTVAPPVELHQQQILVQRPKPVVASYSYTSPSTARPALVAVQQQQVVEKQVTNGYLPPVQQEIVVQHQKPVVTTYRVPVRVEQPVVPVQPAVVSSYSYTAPSTVRPALVAVEKQVTHGYLPPVQQQEVVVQRQKPVYNRHSYPAPVVTVEHSVPVQAPAVVSSYSYTAPSTVRPALVTVQKQVANSYLPPVHPEIVVQKQEPVVTSYSYTAPVTQQRVVPVQPTVQLQSAVQPAVVPNFSYTAAPRKIKPVEFRGYDYPRPQVQFVEEPRPVVTSYETQQPVQEVPFEAKKAYVTGVQQSVSYQNLDKLEGGYVYENPAVPFVEQKSVVVENYRAAVTPKAIVDYSYVQQQTTPRPAVVETYQQVPVVVPSSTPKATIDYTYVQPAQDTYEIRQPVQEVPFEAKKAYVTGGGKSSSYFQQQINKVGLDHGGYVYEKPRVAFIEGPSTSRPIVDYTYVQQQSTTPKPVFVQTYQVPSTTPKAIIDYSYVQPTVSPAVVVTKTSRPIVDYSYVLDQSTPRPTFQSTIQEVVAAKVPQQPSLVVVPTRREKQQRLYLQETVTPTYETVVTTSRPIARYSFSSLDDQYRYVPEVTVPRREYLPARNRVRVTTTTEALSREYLPVRSRVSTTSLPLVTVPSSTYLPVQVPSSTYVPSFVDEDILRVTTRRPIKVKVPTPTYLPVDEEVLSTRRPVKIVKVVRPKTIVKVNDFHPLLSAKLGAQCTCVSNTVKLRNKNQPLRIVVPSDQDNFDDDEDDDGYLVDQPNNNQDGVIVENYQYEPQKLVEITPTPQITIGSSSTTLSSAPAVYAVRKRVRVRPVTTTTTEFYDDVTQAAELFLRKAPPSVTPATVTFVDTEAPPSDKEIAKAVRTGLKLVKQAAKEGAREGTQEAILNGKNFDRYGPGGWRSRNERLQGTVDCQRAGLFRHPTQCNKFYACRWDCTKNRYTLHVFNCPVHLTFDNSLGACNWPSQGPACLENTLLPSD